MTIASVKNVVADMRKIYPFDDNAILRIDRNSMTGKPQVDVYVVDRETEVEIVMSKGIELQDDYF